MRKAAIAAALATVLVMTASVPAAADPAGKSDVMPFDYEFTAFNPCTGQDTTVHFIGAMYIQAVPSIEAFYTEEWTHLTLKWVGGFETQDGYSTRPGHFATQAANAGEDHIAVTETDNIMFNGDDGGKYKVSTRLHVTIAGGELRTFTDTFDSACIRYPED